jgi:hypothetical protein
VKKLLLSFAFLFLVTNFIYAQDAVYKIEFISNWSSTSHPTDYPTGSAHWSSLIGTTHKDASAFVDIGITATDGVEQVAETGGTSLITQEINALISAGGAYQLIAGSGLSSGLGTITIDNVNVDADFPNISLLTMIAPSPDWLAMIPNQKLTDTNDDWLNSLSVDVYATDAGTDSGTTYTSSNADTNPRENISSLENTSPFSGQIIGTFVFTLEQILSVRNEDLDKTIAIYPNPSMGKIFIKNFGNTVLENAEIYATNGKRLQVYTNLNDQNEFELNKLSKGLYFLRLTSNQGNITKKVIVL